MPLGEIVLLVQPPGAVTACDMVKCMDGHTEINGSWLANGRPTFSNAVRLGHLTDVGGKPVFYGECGQGVLAIIT